MYGANSPLGFQEFVMLAAVEMLREDGTGIDLEVIPFRSDVTASTALVTGEIDVSTMNPPSIWAANAAGEEVRYYATLQRNVWRLAAPIEITDPADLDGMRVGHSGTGITQATALSLSGLYGIEPQYLEIGNTESRVQALLQGQIDASPISLEGVVTLERLAPGEFHVLVDFEEAFPDVLFGSSQAGFVDNLDENCEVYETVADYIHRAAVRANEDPQWVADLAIQLLPDDDPDEIRAMAELYAAEDVWFDEPEVSRDHYDRLSQFYVDTGMVEADTPLPYDQVFWTGCD